MARAPQAAEGAEKQDTDIRSIAATLLKTAEPEETPTEDENVDTEAEQETPAAEVDDDTSETPSEDSEEDESPTSGTEEEEDDESSDEEQDEDDEADYLAIEDTDMLSVMVDDEEQEVSIGDLKKHFSLGQATEKRLQEATEARKAANAERVKALEDHAAQTALYDSIFDGLDDNFFKGVIPPPDESMRSSNPEQYLRHKDAYDQEQKHIADARSKLEERREEAKKKRAEALQEYSNQAAEIIAKHIPELADPKTSQQAFSNMANMAQSYGYTPQEINTALDPRMFIIMRDLVSYHNLINKTKGRDVVKNEGQKAKRVRRLRSGNTNAKSRARAADKRRKTASDKARETGKVRDIAATLIGPPSER